MRHTIGEAANLVGRTRRSLYRAMTEGRLVYGLETDGRRYIDTSELLRVYGAFKAPPQPSQDAMSRGVTLPADLAEIIAQAVAKAVEPLRLEIQQLRQENAEQRLISHDKAPEVKAEVSLADDCADLIGRLKARH